VPNQVGLGFIDELKSYLSGLDNRKLAETLIGGLSTHDFPETHGGDALKMVKEAAGATEIGDGCFHFSPLERIAVTNVGDAVTRQHPLPRCPHPDVLPRHRIALGRQPVVIAVGRGREEQRQRRDVERERQRDQIVGVDAALTGLDATQPQRRDLAAQLGQPTAQFGVAEAAGFPELAHGAGHVIPGRAEVGHLSRHPHTICDQR